MPTTVPMPTLGHCGRSYLQQEAGMLCHPTSTVSTLNGDAVIFRRDLLVKCMMAFCLTDEVYALPWQPFLPLGRFNFFQDSRIFLHPQVKGQYQKSQIQDQGLKIESFCTHFLSQRELLFSSLAWKVKSIGKRKQKPRPGERAEWGARVFLMSSDYSPGRKIARHGNTWIKPLPTARGHKRAQESRTRARGMVKGKCASGLLSKEEGRGCLRTTIW